MQYVDTKTRNEHLASSRFKWSVWIKAVFNPSETARLHREIAAKDDHILSQERTISSLRMKNNGLMQDKNRAEASFEDALVRLSNHENVGAIKR